MLLVELRAIQPPHNWATQVLNHQIESQHELLKTRYGVGNTGFWYKWLWGISLTLDGWRWWLLLEQLLRIQKSSTGWQRNLLLARGWSYELTWQSTSYACHCHSAQGLPAAPQHPAHWGPWAGVGGHSCHPRVTAAPVSVQVSSHSSAPQMLDFNCVVAQLTIF